tara:strand:- start:224 stop:544 length:321 start_codon:yes stop_codon:yes gene_type:complete
MTTDVPIMLAMFSGSGKIHITGGSVGDYTKTLSGRKLPTAVRLEEVLPAVEQITSLEEYNLRDLHMLQWEDWSEVVKFSPIKEFREGVIEPMLKNGMAHNKWKELQ